MSSYSVNLERIRRDKGVVYRIDFRVQGKRIRQTVGSDKRTAELIRAETERSLILGTYKLRGAKANNPNMQQLITEFLRSIKNNVRPQSLARYQTYLTRFSDYFKTFFPAVFADIGMIREKYIREFIDKTINDISQTTSRWSSRTMNSAMTTIKTLFKFAVDEGYLQETPIKRIRQLKGNLNDKPEFFSDEELEKLWRTIDPYWVDPLKFILNTGLRKGELINLRWDNVDLSPANPRITVTPSEEWTTKSGKSRIIPLNNVALEIIKRWKGRDSVYVFVSKRGHKVNDNAIYDELKRALNELGVKGHIHKLRTTFASKLAMKGVSQLAISELLGHSDLDTTKIYTGLSPNTLRGAVNALDDETTSSESNGDDDSKSKGRPSSTSQSGT